jgi:hypothetical protein
MRMPRVRFTVPGMMNVIAAAAVLSAIAYEVGRRRDLQLEREILVAKVAMNRRAQAKMKAICEEASRRLAPPEELRDCERSLAELAREGQALDRRLSLLRP